jgi:galactose-1-phosphate uridylyltransferase
MLNYAVLRNMYHSRKYHKLDEWVAFCRWVEKLPYSELITKNYKDETGDE